MLKSSCHLVYVCLIEPAEEVPARESGMRAHFEQFRTDNVHVHIVSTSASCAQVQHLLLGGRVVQPVVAVSGAGPCAFT
jgi:hypothetical protein